MTLQMRIQVRVSRVRKTVRVAQNAEGEAAAPLSGSSLDSAKARAIARQSSRPNLGTG
jgi:hypothetical protein